MARFFDGKKKAEKLQNKLIVGVKKLKEKGVKPKLVSILVGDNKASELYVNLKRKRGEEIGIQVEIKKFKKRISVKQVIKLIDKLNGDKNVHGIMVQLPLPKVFSESQRNEILESISLEKDVDGLRKRSLYTTPVVAAVFEAIKLSKAWPPKNQKVLIVGATGFEGGKIAKKFKKEGYKVTGVNSKTNNIEKITLTADVLISATGEPGLIGGDMVKDGAVVIDVGSPRGDVKTDEVSQKASFISAVPGGIGPVTISGLLVNVVAAASKTTKKTKVRSQTTRGVV